MGRGRGSGRKGVACGRRRTTDDQASVLDDGQDRGEAGKVGDNRKSRTSAEKGGRETKGGLEMAYSAARHGHDTQRADDTDKRRKRDKGGQNQCSRRLRAALERNARTISSKLAQAVDRPRQAKLSQAKRESAKREPSQGDTGKEPKATKKETSV